MSEHPQIVARPAVLAELDGSRHAVVEASAGTGKTFTLEHIVVDLVLEGVSIDEILVVTFTEKAAGELKVRLRQKLQAFADGTVPSADSGPTWALDTTARERLSKALLGFDRATIATIHAFCQRVLLEHAFSHGRPFRQELVDGKAAFDQAFHHILRTELSVEAVPKAWLSAWLESHTVAQLAELSFRCHERGGQIEPPFDPAAWSRALLELSRAPTHPRVVRPLLRRAGVGVEDAKRMLAQIETVRRLSELSAPRALRAISELEDDPIPSLAAALRTAEAKQAKLRHLREAVEGLEVGGAPLEAVMMQVVLPRVRRVLRADKASRGELDFSDMLTLLDESLSSEGGTELVEELRARYPVALIDEFQDTDDVQWRIFRRLYIDDETGKRRLFVIGDPKQAIYGFRGANVATYLQAREHMVEAGARRVALTESYRSSPPLVEALDAVFDPKAEPKFFPGAIQYTDPVTAGNPMPCGIELDGRPAPAAVLLQPRMEETPVRGPMARKALLSIIGAEIRALLDSSSVQVRRYGDEPRRLTPSDIFVLTRSAYEGEQVAEALRALDIPVSLYKQEGLLSSPEALHVRALLAAIADPHQPGLALRAFATPFFGVPLERLARHRGHRGNDAMLSQLLDWKVIADRRDYPRLFASILEDGGAPERLLFSGVGERALASYRQLFEVLQAEAEQRPPIQELVHRLGAFIDKRARPSDETANLFRRLSDDDAVQVMTMHKSKGLEAEVVFLFGGLSKVTVKEHAYHAEGQRRLFLGEQPPASALEDAREEMRRLLYVALTRARSRIYVPWFGSAPDGGPSVRDLDGLQGLLEPHLDRLAVHPEAGWTVMSMSPERTRAPRERRAAHHLALPPEQLRPPRPSEARTAQDRIGPVITSYSRLKAEAEAHGGQLDERIEELSRGTDALPPEALPPGAASGLFLHEALEKVQLPLQAEGPSELLEAEREVFTSALRRHHRDPRHLEHGAELVWAGLRSPLELGPFGVLPEGLHAAERVLREMEFLFPVPAAPDTGFVKGFVDVLFEHEGRVYVLDWKSDDLPSYAPEVVDAHVQDSYLLQAKLYAIATARLLSLNDEASYEARFGGALYAFLRGMGPEGRGQWSWRPTWRELMAASAEVAVHPGDRP